MLNMAGNRFALVYHADTCTVTSLALAQQLVSRIAPADMLLVVLLTAASEPAESKRGKAR